MGEKVFFAGQSQTFPSGNKLVHGGQGEVVGPATLETHKGKGVDVLFPGNQDNISLYLTEVRRLRVASAATPRLPPHTRDAAHAPTARPPHTPAVGVGLRRDCSCSEAGAPWQRLWRGRTGRGQRRVCGAQAGGWQRRRRGGGGPW